MNSSRGLTLPRWSTSTLADAEDSVPADLDALGAHVSLCNGSRGRWFSLVCAADAMHVFVAGHFVTTLLLAGAAVGIASVWL